MHLCQQTATIGGMKRAFLLCLLCLTACEPPAQVYREKLSSGQVESGLDAAAALPAGALPIAVIQAYTGKYKRTADNTLDGARLAIEQINAGGGLQGRNLALLEVDTQGSLYGADAAAAAALEQPLLAGIAPARSAEARMVVPRFEAAGVPLLLHFATHPELTQESPHVFRVCHNDALQGKVLARFARERLGASNAVLVTDESSPSNIRLAESFNQQFRFLGGTVRAELALAETPAVISQLAELDPDVVLAAMYVFEAGDLLRRAQNLGLRARFLGGDGWGNTNLFIAAGSAARGHFFSTHWSEQSDSPESIAFVEAFFLRYERVPTIASALAYDAVQVLASALAGQLLEGKPAELCSTLQAGLATLEGHRGVTGTIAFDPQGDAVKPVFIERLGMFRFEHEAVLGDVP